LLSCSIRFSIVFRKTLVFIRNFLCLSYGQIPGHSRSGLRLDWGCLCRKRLAQPLMWSVRGCCRKKFSGFRIRSEIINVSDLKKRLICRVTTHACSAVFATAHWFYSSPLLCDTAVHSELMRLVLLYSDRNAWLQVYRAFSLRNFEETGRSTQAKRKSFFQTWPR